MPFTYEYPRPALTTDIILTRTSNNKVEILLIRRKKPPYQGMWALPGGFVEINETLLEAACRELQEETNIHFADLEQFHVFDSPDRDPRGRTISVVFTGKVPSNNINPRASSDAAEARWSSISELPELAFDHAVIIQKAKEMGQI